MEVKITNKKVSEEDRTVIMSDEYLSESGVQGGKIVGEHLALGSFLVGIPFFIIGLYGLVSIFFDLEFPTNTAVIIAALLVTIIGLLFIIGGYFIYQDKHDKKSAEKHPF